MQPLLRSYLTGTALALLAAPALIVLRPPWWICLLVLFIMILGRRTADAVLLGCNVWALVTALRQPRHWTSLVFFAGLAVYLVWAVLRLRRLRQKPAASQMPSRTSQPIRDRISVTPAPADPYATPAPVSRLAFLEWYAYHHRKPWAMVDANELALAYSRYLTRRLPQTIGPYQLTYAQFRAMYQADKNLLNEIPDDCDPEVHLTSLYDSLQEKANTPGATNTEG